jgi:hypothetical protein
MKFILLICALVVALITAIVSESEAKTASPKHGYQNAVPIGVLHSPIGFYEGRKLKRC